jgi:DNA-binding transcriptional MocR family regulator
MQEKLYEQVADRIVQQVDQGIYRPGDRLPSVRRLSTQMRVSVSTILQAYGLLQDRRLIEPKPQSGYFLCQPLQAPPAPEMSNPTLSPTQVSVSELAMKVVQANDKPGIVQFGTALPSTDFPAIRQLHRQLSSAARILSEGAASYAVPPGHPGLRLQIARRAVDAGYTLTPDDIVITNGCQEALVLCLRAVADPGATIAIESPSFYGTLQAIECLGMQALEIPTHPETGISLAALELALEQWPIKACVLTPSYSNPLGYCMADDNKGALVALLAKHHVPLIEDDIYGDLGYGQGGRPRAVKSWDGEGRVLLCSSISKTLDPSLRIGWAVPGRYFKQVQHLKLVTSMASATLPQIAVAEYLSGGSYDRHLRSARVVYRRRRDQLIELVDKHFPKETRLTRPEGGFLAWIELPKDVDSMGLYRNALQHGISIAPGPLFSPKRKFRNFIRINYGRPWSKTTEQAMATLGELAKCQANPSC